MSADNRSVATDALATLGTIIDANQKRDAIHLAVIPVEAAEEMWRGQDVGILGGKATTKTKNLVGIVDPFLSGAVKKGQWFWLVIYPRKITSLRHVWSHPEFSDEPEVGRGVEPSPTDPVEISRKWIEDFASSIEQTYNALMRAADYWIDCGEYTYDNSESYKGHWDKFPEFWKHYEVVTGRKPDSNGDTFFTCSC